MRDHLCLGRLGLPARRRRDLRRGPAGNTRAAATVRRNGMQWVGETGKYFNLALQVFLLRSADLDRAAASAQIAPAFKAD